MPHFPYEIPVLGTIGVFIVASVAALIARKVIEARDVAPKEHYRLYRLTNTVITVLTVAAIIGFWTKVFEHKGQFLGLIGAGLAISLREPLLSIAGRIAIFAGHMYSGGDRIEINKLSGDVIDIGFFYTRMMEIGNWISGDQYSGRTIQFANAQVFGTPVFNYTRTFGYIWDEIKIPITYASNVKALSEILKSVGHEYTQQFLQGAQRQLDRMQRYFMVQHFELEPDVYIKVTDNYIELTLRYVVDPKQRRKASSFIFAETFRKLRERNDIQIGSTTMDLTVHPSDAQAKGDEQTKAADDPTAAVGKPSQLADTQEQTASEIIGEEGRSDSDKAA
ncbi:MAG TPA: mechanosensitive ion channel family protein [Terriglobales bacterium]|nr:mechanosensitive ion channel family protein [Terriglobales bacterium]